MNNIRSLIVLIAVLSINLFSCIKKEKNKLKGDIKSTLKHSTSKKKLRGNSFMGCFNKEYLGGAGIILGYNNYICDIDPINGSLQNIKTLSSYWICETYYDFKIIGLSFIPTETLTFHNAEHNQEIQTMSIDMVGVITKINGMNKANCQLIYINSLTGIYLEGPSIPNGYKHCEFDMSTSQLFSYNQINDEFDAIDYWNGTSTFIDNNKQGIPVASEGKKKGFYIRNGSEIGYLYSDISTVGVPWTNSVYHFTGETGPTSTSPWFGTNGSPIYYNLSSINQVQFATSRTAIEVYNGNSYVCFQGFDAALMAIVTDIISPSPPQVFKIGDKLEDFTDN